MMDCKKGNVIFLWKERNIVLRRLQGEIKEDFEGEKKMRKGKRKKFIKEKKEIKQSNWENIPILCRKIFACL